MTARFLWYHVDSFFNEILSWQTVRSCQSLDGPCLYASWPLLRFFRRQSGTLEKQSVAHGSRTGLLGRLGRQYFRSISIASNQAHNDQISFGASPAAAAFAIGIRTPLDHVCLTFFVICALLRLARFNVTVATLPKDKTGKSKYFEGTPAPTSLSIAALMAYWVNQGSILDRLPLGVVAQGTPFELHPVVGLFVLHGCLMCSKTLKVPKP